MGQGLHACARITQAIGEHLQNSQASLAKLAGQHALNPKTVAKGKQRTFVHDAPMGPKVKRSTVLSLEADAAIVAFRKPPFDRWTIAYRPCKRRSRL